VSGAGLVWRPLATEPVDLVVPPGHPLATRRGLGMRHLATVPWIVGCERCREHAVALCSAASFAPDVRHVTDDYVVVQNLVAVGLGVALLPRSALEAFRHPEVEVRQSRVFGSRTFGIVHRAGAETVPATAALVGELTRVPDPA
jgi:DNA-binding transcriptional LysR family regulator